MSQRTEPPFSSEISQGKPPFIADLLTCSYDFQKEIPEKYGMIFPALLAILTAEGVGLWIS